MEDILVHAGLLGPTQLEQVHREQQTGECGFLPALWKLQLAPEERLLETLAAHFDLPWTNLTGASPDAEAAARLTTSYLTENQLLPLKSDGPALLVAIGDLSSLARVDEAAMLLGRPVQAILSSPARLAQAIQGLGQAGSGAVQTAMDGLSGGPEAVSESSQPSDEAVDLANEAPVIKMVNLILLQGINEGASDIHLEPYENDMVVRYRIDGLLREGPRPAPQHRHALISRLKIMGRLDIAERRLPQDGRIKLRLLDKEYDIRLSTLPGLHGESVVMRVLDQSKILYDLDDIGFEPRMLAAYKALLEQENGIVLVTGPTGSGKTTTLYASLNRLNRPDVKIITVEDPVEYRLRGLIQIQTQAGIGLTFAAALRSILRQDPDVVMIGEMRDLETASIGVQAALTGHLVFSTLHTNDSASAVTRLVDMGVAPYLIASVTRGVLAQRLARRICPNCREAYSPEQRELLQMFAALPGGEQKVECLYRGKGCSDCHGSGYRGRLGIYELLVPDDGVRQLVLKGAAAHEIAARAAASGSIMLREDAVLKVLAGRTTLSEVLGLIHGED